MSPAIVTDCDLDELTVTATNAACFPPAPQPSMYPAFPDSDFEARPDSIFLGTTDFAFFGDESLFPMIGFEFIEHDDSYFAIGQSKIRLFGKCRIAHQNADLNIAARAVKRDFSLFKWVITHQTDELSLPFGPFWIDDDTVVLGRGSMTILSVVDARCGRMTPLSIRGGDIDGEQDTEGADVVTAVMPYQIDIHVSLND